MVQLGIANSRMKDFYDIWSVLNLFDFTGEILSQAIKETFLRRKTELPKGQPIAFTEEFYSDLSKRQQWGGFVQRNHLQIEQKELPEIMISISSFLMPVLEALSNERDFSSLWPVGGPWLACPAKL